MPISRGLFWQAAAADKASKGSGDNAAVLEAALLYLEADKCIEAACASVRVAANVQATLAEDRPVRLKVAQDRAEKILATPFKKDATLCDVLGGGRNNKKVTGALKRHAGDEKR